MVEKIKENIIIYIITTILGALLAFFGFSFLELRNDVKNMNMQSSSNTIIISEIRDDLELLREDLNIIRENSVEIGKLQTVYSVFNESIRDLETRVKILEN
jgi:hypothetical protein